MALGDEVGGRTPVDRPPTGPPPPPIRPPSPAADADEPLRRPAQQAITIVPGQGLSTRDSRPESPEAPASQAFRHIYVDPVEES
jgi:hypothetical protein